MRRSSTATCCDAADQHARFHLQALLGVNVIGTVVAWGLMLLTLMENPFGSGLMFDNLAGNNFVQVREPRVHTDSDVLR